MSAPGSNAGAGALPSRRHEAARRVRCARWMLVAGLAALGTLGPQGGVSLGAAPGAGPPSPSPSPSAAWLSLKPDAGFYDEAWALDSTGTRLAVIHTNRDDFQRVEVYSLQTPGATPLATFDLGPPARVFESLSFLPGGAGFLVVSAASGDAHVVETVDGAGKPLGKAGPLSDFGIPLRAGDPLLVTFDRQSGRAGETTYVVSPRKLPGLQPAGKPRAHVVKADGTLRSPALVPIGFFDGYSKLLAQRTGWYDKKKDARQPDGRAVVDLLSGKVITDAPIEDVTGWARTTRLRREHPNRTAFVMLADTVAGDAHAKPGVELLDPEGRLFPLPLAVAFRFYDRFTLKDQEGPDAGVIHFGLQVDPVNADAVARKKADAAALDVYTVPLGAPTTCRLRARVPVGGQPVAWGVAGNRLVVLRRFKNFVRGGDRLDVYELTP
ncbi:MAG: hypothetical protein ABUL77_00990 [Bacteroidota bacterium]